MLFIPPRRRNYILNRAFQFVLLLAVSMMWSALACAGSEGELEIFPQKVVLSSPSRTCQLVATGIQANDAVDDVTRQCKYEIADEAVASVTADGLIVGKSNGETTLRVSWENRSVEIPIVASGLDQPQQASFRLDIMPILTRTGCNQGTCHGSLTGKGGFRLSLRGDDPAGDRFLITREALGRRIDVTVPRRSLFLQQPIGELPHEGGQRFAVDSSEYRLIEDWIARGANDDVEAIPALQRIEVYPQRQVLNPGNLEQQLTVTAHFADGSVRDVTSLASYETNAPVGVKVTPQGRVVVESPMEVVVSVRYIEERSISRLVFLPPSSDYDWYDREPNNFIDETVAAKLRTLRIVPSPVIDDNQFLRRVFLATLGVLPTVEEVDQFINDPNPDKRQQWIDRIVERPEFADFWALKWADVLRNEQKAMSTKGVWTFRRWLVRQIDNDASFRDVAYQILSSTGTTYQNPATGFYRTNREPTVIAEAVAQVFLGYRLQCAKCHNHPFDIWKQDDYYGLAAYFSTLQRKQTTNIRRDSLDKHEINGDEIVYLSGKAEIRQPVRNVMMSPQPLSLEPVSNETAETEDPLKRLAEWVTSDRQFARNVANRTWYHLMGVGIVDAPDDFRVSNPPSNPELMEALTDCFIEGDYRLKPLVATILKSKTFQRSAVPNDSNRDDQTNFSRYPVRLMQAEVLLDAVSQFLEVPEQFENAPAGTRAVQLPGVHPTHPFLKEFGKPIRLITCECERSSETTLGQAFQLINGELVRKKLEAKDNRIGRLLREKVRPQELVDNLYLASLSRNPTAAELQAALNHLENAENIRQAAEDLAWALLNSKEFLLLR